MTHRARHLLPLLRRPGAVWLALCIALLGALAPTVSHALNWARGGNAGLIEVCTANGPRWMALPDLTQRTGGAQLENTQTNNNPDAVAIWPDGPLPATVLDHCPFCLLFADRIAPPPPAWQVALAVAVAAFTAPMPQAPYFPAFYAHTPPPRGPPANF